MDIRFLLNGESVALADVSPTETLLDWLRERRGLTGTKEGCNEGDCGACTVMVTDAHGARALNACILFLPQLHGRAVRTVEGIAGPEGQGEVVFFYEATPALGQPLSVTIQHSRSQTLTRLYTQPGGSAAFSRRTVQA